MSKEDWSYIRDEGIQEALNRFKRSLVSGRKSYFDVSEFEGIVEYLLDEGDLKTSEIAALQGIQIHPGAVPLQLKYAQVLLSKGKYQNALKYLNLAEQVELTNPDVHLMKGSAWLVMGNETEAEKSFEKALKNAGHEKDDILYHIGSSYVQTGDIPKAVSYFEESLLENPENELALYDLGFFSDQEGNYQKSIEYYNRYLDIDPFNFSIWFNLGISYNKAGEFTKAIEAYEYVLALNEDFDQALFNIGNTYANAGKYTEAISKYREYLEIDPENDDAYCYIGECYLNLDDNDRAEENYRNAINLNSENDSAIFGLGLVMWIESRWRKSIKCIKQALKIDNLNIEYWLALAKVHKDAGHHRAAERTVLNAVELEPENSDVYLTWCDVLIRQNAVDDAIKVINTGMEKNEDTVLKYRMVSLLLEKDLEKEAFDLLLTAMKQDFINLNYFFEVYPKAIGNKKLQKVIDKFRKSNNL